MVARQNYILPDSRISLPDRAMADSMGIATMEASAILLVLLPIVIGVVGFLKFAGNVSAANATLDKVLYDGGVRPLKRISSSSGSSIQLNTEGINQFGAQLVSAIESELTEKLGTDAVSPDKYLIEFKAISVPINPVSGAVNGPFSEFTHAVVGTLSPSGESESATNLTDEFNRFISESAPAQSGSSEGAPSLIATPTASLGRVGSAHGYLPQAVLVGARIVMSLEETASGKIYSVIGGKAVASERKVILLRGEIE